MEKGHSFDAAKQESSMMATSFPIMQFFLVKNFKLNYPIHILVLFYYREIFGTVAKHIEYNNTACDIS